MEKVVERFTNIKLSNNIEKQLNNNFDNAMKDNNFKLLVDKIKLKKDVLVNYTSILEESAIEFGNCLKCPGILECNNKIEGYAYLPTVHNGELQFNYQACHYKNKLTNETKYLDNIHLFDMPKEIKEARMANIYTDDKKRFETIKWLKSFITSYQKDKNQKGLYLHGNFGCGKTYLIAAMFNELAKLNIKSAIVFWPEFLRNLKGSFQTDFNEKFEYIKKIPLLLIDDIGAENMTSWARDEIFCPIIQYRMQESLPTFFTSNLDLKALEEHFAVSKDSVESVKAKRIIERVIQLTEAQEMVSKNLRK